MGRNIVSLKKSSEEDYIEPELVSRGPQGYESRAEDTEPDGRRIFYGGTYTAGKANPFCSFFLKIKLVFTAAALLAGFGLIVLGALLTSTLVGAVIGIPLILLGVFLFRLLFKFPAFGGKNF